MINVTAPRKRKTTSKTAKATMAASAASGGKGVGSEPHMSLKYEDMPDGAEIKIPVVLIDRAEAVCGDVHHCTISNAIARTVDTVGILALDRRGTSRTFVGFLADPKVYKWAKPGVWYRAALDNDSKAVVLELDILAQENRKKEAAIRAAIKKRIASTGPDLEMYTVKLVPVAPSLRKGYRKGETVRGKTGTGTRTRAKNLAPRREWKPDPKFFTE